MATVKTNLKHLKNGNFEKVNVALKFLREMDEEGYWNATKQYYKNGYNVDDGFQRFKLSQRQKKMYKQWMSSPERKQFRIIQQKTKLKSLGII